MKENEQGQDGDQRASGDLSIDEPGEGSQYASGRCTIFPFPVGPYRDFLVQPPVNSQRSRCQVQGLSGGADRCHWTDVGSFPSHPITRSGTHPRCALLKFCVRSKVSSPNFRNPYSLRLAVLVRETVPPSRTFPSTGTRVQGLTSLIIIVRPVPPSWTRIWGQAHFLFWLRIHFGIRNSLTHTHTHPRHGTVQCHRNEGGTYKKLVASHGLSFLADPTRQKLAPPSARRTYWSLA